MFTVGWELFFAGVKHGDDVGVVQRCRGVCFALKPGLELRVAREVRAHHFDGDGTAEAGVVADVDIGHAAAAN
ncbi:hypothetical protein QT23_00335 [Staphylococcus aureus]|nr:hypothetical protein QT23_00335 [Staphylococcus aureus]